MPDADFHGKMWAVTKGPCKTDEKGCITSPGFPHNYSADTYCAIAVNSSSAVPIHVEEFETEPGFDPGQESSLCCVPVRTVECFLLCLRLSTFQIIRIRCL